VAAGFVEVAVTAIRCQDSPAAVRAAWLKAVRHLAADADACTALVEAGAREAVQQAAVDAATAGTNGGSDEAMAMAAMAAAEALQQT
jgi:hypothetical protein